MRKYQIIQSSLEYFEKYIEKNEIEEECSFNELIRWADTAKMNSGAKYPQVDALVIRNHDYQGITNEANNRLDALIEDITSETATIIIHNPSQRIEQKILSKYSESLIESEDYSVKIDDFSNLVDEIRRKIIGQREAVLEIIKSLNYLTKSRKSQKPYVILLYGNSSLGKTEIVKEVAKHFYNGLILEQHLSMWQSVAYGDYLFGNNPTSVTLAFELLERRSNLLFLDEFDKLTACFLPALYTLFDNTEFKDKTYSVDISNLVIFLTANYRTENEVLKHLGEPIFYRIDKMIGFHDFDTEDIKSILDLEIRNRKEDFESFSSIEEVTKQAMEIVDSQEENGRTIKQKVQTVIEELAFDQFNSDELKVLNENKHN
jgi:ATP-dependent Clp protease ATP-binding subunit ClpA